MLFGFGEKCVIKGGKLDLSEVWIKVVVHQKSLQLMVVLFLFVNYSSCVPVETPCFPKFNKCSLNSTSNSNINISTVELIYKINSTGGYHCRFELVALGNSLTETGSGECQFIIQSPPIEGLELEYISEYISGDKINPDMISDDNISTISFPTGIIPSNHRFSIIGHFYGIFNTNSSGKYSYQLGIDWGTTVLGEQSAEIRIDDCYSVVKVFPAPRSTQTLLNYDLQYSWGEVSTTGFIALIEIIPKPSSEPFLEIGIASWNASAGERRFVSIRNTVEFNITGFILTPSWIKANDSNLFEFELSLQEQILVEFTVDHTVPVGSNGSITIVSSNFDTIEIPVRVISASPTSPDLIPLLQIASFLSLIAILGVIVYKRDEIIHFSREYRKDFSKKDSSSQVSDGINSLGDQAISDTISETQDTTWEEIQAKWETILPEKELHVISILFYQGSKNQKTIAKEIGVSKVTMSRIISRLETKRLVIRERFGISNMIKLKKDHLV